MLSSDSNSLDLSSSIDGGEQDGGIGDPINNIISVTSVASCCTLVILFGVMVGVLANKSYCK
jgi:ABC-type phosphate/phosphonate transport system permease subunit